jgi:hypothetical protein
LLYETPAARHKGTVSSHFIRDHQARLFAEKRLGSHVTLMPRSVAPYDP